MKIADPLCVVRQNSISRNAWPAINSAGKSGLGHIHIGFWRRNAEVWLTQVYKTDSMFDTRSPRKSDALLDDQPTVFVEVAPQEFETRPIQVGLSNGLLIEILGGLNEHDRIRIPAISTLQPENA